MQSAIAAGTRLGPYEVQELIGAGGMGEVYRSRDTRLGRNVAVKVLPREFARDADRLRRFEQEARATGQLNHPNILAIYDIGNDGGVPFIVTELLEGTTLRELVSHGPMPPRRAILLAGEIANGLAAAHAKGIAHRDLKPENLFVIAGGHVKILDFGLAKLLQADGQAGDGTVAIAPDLTATGTILGTASYMAPEQVRQQAADHRSDIFSLGCILYEMLAGHRAFEGETPMDRLSAILHAEPPELPEDVEESAPGISKIVRRCLEKHADDRFESARELAFVLDLVGGRGTRRAAAEAKEAEPAQTGSGYGARLRRVTYREGTIHAARFSPDGQSVYYSAAWEGRPIELFWAHSGNPESRPLGARNTDILAIAQGGDMAVSLRRHHRGGFVYAGMLARMPLGGGAARELLDEVNEADWSPDGRQLAITREVSGMSRLEYPIGKVLHQSAGWQSHLRISPDGQRVAFLDHPVRGNDAGSAVVVDVEGRAKVLSSGWSSTQGLVWSPDGREVWFTAFRTEAARSLYAVSMDGALRPLFQTPGHLIVQDVARDGSVLVVHGNERSRMEIVGADDPRPRDLTWLDWTITRDLSPDGRTVVFDETGTAGGELHAMYMREADGSPAIKLGDGYGGRLSPDGHWVLAGLGEGPARMILLPTGAGETRIAPTGKLDCHNAVWFPDGRRICVVGNEAGEGLRLFEIDLESGAQRAFSEEGVSSADLVAYPDGRSVGCRGPNQEWRFYSLDGGDAPPIDVRPDERPIGWNAEGSALYVFSRGQLPAKVFRLDAAGGKRTLARELSPSDPTGVGGLTTVRMTPDGETFAYSFAQSLCDLYVIEGLR